MPITLSKDQISQINAALAAIKDAKTEILRAKQAQIDVAVEESALLGQEARLLALKRVYGTAKS